MSNPEVEPEMITDDGFNPLLLAALNNHTNVVRVLLSRMLLSYDAINLQESMVSEKCEW